ncbi:MAG: radical SAM protein [Bacteroidetes bacterium]|nr:radical SAM protein [Bacteroidota bacterium]
MKYKQILLTRPPTGSNALQGGSDADPHPQPPLGLAYLAGVLERLSDVNVLDILDGNFSENYVYDVKMAVKKHNPDLVGFSAFTPFANPALEATKTVKEINSEILTVLGGPHAVLADVTMRKCPDLDVIVYDEGEEQIEEIVSGKPLDDIAGLFIRKEGKIVPTSPRSYIDNMDSLPYPAYHKLPHFPDGYHPHPPKSTGRKWCSIMWSRGCPFFCNYCNRENSFGLKFRNQSPEYVVDHIRFLNSEYGIEELTFYDDVMSLNRKATMTLMESMRKENLGFEISWDAETRVDLVDPELLHAMKKAGCRMISYGIEHGEFIYEIKGGTATIQQAEDAVRWTHNAKMDTVGYFMIGLPKETPKTIRTTIDFAKKLDCTYAQFAITMPFPGNKLYDEAIKSGLIQLDDTWDKFVYAGVGSGGIQAPVLTTKSLSAKDLEYWAKRAYREFYFRPSYIIKKLLRIRSLQDLMMYYNGYKMLKKDTA